MIEQSYVLDVVPGGVAVVVHCHQNDVMARVFELRLVSRNGVPVIPAGASAFIEGQKVDGKVFSYEEELTSIAGETSVIVSLREQMTVLAGDVKCQCKITSEGQVLICANFILRVEEDYTVGADTSETEIPGMVQQAQAAAEAAEAAAQNIDDEWFINGANSTNISTLETSNKRVVSAINEVRTQARGTGLIRGEAQQTDANDIDEPGWHYINPEKTTLNLPVNKSGFMEVYKGTQTTYKMQRFTVTSDMMSYKRLYRAGSWTEWKSYDGAADVDSIPDILGSGLRVRGRRTGAMVWLTIYGSASETRTSVVFDTYLPTGWIPGTGVGAGNARFDQIVAWPSDFTSGKPIFGRIWIDRNNGKVSLSDLKTTSTDGSWIDANLVKGTWVYTNISYIAEQ